MSCAGRPDAAPARWIPGKMQHRTLSALRWSVLSRPCLQLVLAAGLLLALAACGGKAATSGPAVPGASAAPAVQPAQSLAQLPAPSALLARHASGGGADLRRDGWDTDAGLAEQLAIPSASAMTFSPNFTPGVSAAGGVAYALYRLNSTGYAGDPSVRLGWDTAPASGTVWVGLPDLTADRWTWHALSASNRLPLAGGVAAVSEASGDLLVLVAVTGSANCTLSYVRLGNEPPHPVLNATPTAGVLPLTTNFDANSSFDPDGTLTFYEIDFGDGNGFQPMPGASAQHAYTTLGPFTATLRLTDNEGGVATLPTEIDAGVAPNLPPVASFTASSATGLPGDTITLDAGSSSDPDGTIADYEWDPEGDGTFLVNFFPGGSSMLGWVYSQPGTYHPTLRITDNKGASAKASKTVTISFGTLVSAKKLDSDTCQYPSIGVANGKLCVAFRDGSQLAFIRETAANGENWFSAQLLGNMGIGCSLANVAGSPAIAYHSGGSECDYVRAANPDGSAWTSALTAISGTDNIGLYPTLAVISGNPAIVCSDASAFVAGNCWYCIATNSTGTSWSAKKVISANGEHSIATSLIALGNGTPCAAMMRNNGLSSFDEVQFTPALDAQGNTWNPPIPVESGNVLQALTGSLQIVAGRPAMLYYDLDLGQVLYVRSSDAGGLGWNTAVEVTAAAQTEANMTLGVINGLPVAAFVDTTLGLRICLAADNAGSTWNPPLTVDAAATDPATAISMTSYNSRPAIAYTTGGPLKLARWK